MQCHLRGRTSPTRARQAEQDKQSRGRWQRGIPAAVASTVLCYILRSFPGYSLALAKLQESFLHLCNFVWSLLDNAKGSIPAARTPNKQR